MEPISGFTIYGGYGMRHSLAREGGRNAGPGAKTISGVTTRDGGEVIVTGDGPGDDNSEGEDKNIKE